MPEPRNRRQGRPGPEELRRAAEAALRALEEPAWQGFLPGWHERMPEEQSELMLDNVVKACQAVESHPALRLVGTCGHLAGYCAIVIDEFYGVAVAATPYLQPANRRTGGFGDLAFFPPSGGPAPWIFGVDRVYPDVDESFFGDPNDTPIFGRDLPYFQLGPSATFHEPIPPDCDSGNVLGLGWAGEVYRSTLLCRRCGATEPVKTSTLLRKMLQAIVKGETEVRLGSAPPAVPSGSRGHPGAVPGSHTKARPSR
ncbi:MAG: hypothetical protein ABSA65_05280 [Acidimicrobiales bacterium]